MPRSARIIFSFLVSVLNNIVYSYNIHYVDTKIRVKVNNNNLPDKLLSNYKIPCTVITKIPEFTPVYYEAELD